MAILCQLQRSVVSGCMMPTRVARIRLSIDIAHERFDGDAEPPNERQKPIDLHPAPAFEPLDGRNADARVARKRGPS
jgi:hypothetical protein